jgi:hypothetical protein
MPDSELEMAIDLAIESMIYRRASCKSLWRDWQTYGEALAFRKEEARRTAALYERLTAAIEVLRQEMRTE